MSEYSYKVEKNPADLGGGWRLRLFEDGEEVDVRIFYPTYYGDFTDDETAFEEAYTDANSAGREWVATQKPTC